MSRAHPKSGEVVGPPPGQLDGGKVSERHHRWFSRRWWRGHWFGRTRDGEWRDPDDPSDISYRDTGHYEGGAYDPRREHLQQLARERKRKREEKRGGRAWRQAERSRQATEYRDYLRSRHDEADRATRGTLVSKAGEARGVTGASFFDPRRPNPSRRWMSEELRTWLDDHGENMTATEYRRQSVEEEPEDDYRHDPTWGMYEW